MNWNSNSLKKIVRKQGTCAVKTASVHLLQLRNDKGFALVTSLMFSLIGLGISLCLLYIISSGTKLSGTNKRYNTVREATYGGADILIKDLVPYILKDINSATLGNDLSANYSILQNLSAQQAICLQAKITTATSTWPTACVNAQTPSRSPDLVMNLQGAASSNNFLVYTKITSTKTGNTSMSGLALDGASVSETSSILTPPHIPYLYTIEAQGKKTGDSSVTSDLEVLYAY